ncbi:hypothetical protein, partial [Pontibacter sp. BAB1700]|uniref:hypothetical protein n=1 Tax=Pontibacter sp. BAB1700 TaxID=1144253 RepID=UPI00058C8BED
AQVATSISINNYLVFESTDEGSNQMWKRERSARKSYLDKLSRNEDVQRDYFDDKPEGAE